MFKLFLLPLVTVCLIVISVPSQAGTITYSYDSQNRIVSANYGDGLVASYTYDAAGNRLTQVVTSVAPTFTAQPQSQNAGSTAIATLSATLNGTDPFFYQWYQGSSGDTSNPLNGATLASFTTPALTAPTSFWVRVANGAGTVDSDTATVTVTPGTLALAAATYGVTEGTATLSIPVVRTSGSDGQVTVNYTLLGITAGSTDFTGTGGTITLIGGQTNQNIVIPIVNDLLIEGPETFSLSLVSTTGGATLGATTSATITINDNDDTDGDGIVDQWEKDHFQGLLTVADQGTDKDGDGYSDLVESQRGTDPNVADEPIFQSDAAIGPVGQPKKMIGKNKYEATGEEQTFVATVKRKTAKTALIVIQNDGTKKDTIHVQAEAGDSANFAVRYRLNKKDVTADAVAGTLTIPNLKPGKTVTLKAIITVKKSAAKGDPFQTKIDTWSEGDPNALHDAVIYAVTAK